MAENIFLFVPNLIGYVRIVLAFISFYYMTVNYKISCFCYLLSAFLDAFDGHAARLLNQSTKFGAILDQITDRCATLCLCMGLGNLYPRYLFVFQVVCVIDIAGHWIHIWSSAMQGKGSHKYVKPDENPILAIYYTSRPILFIMCATNELFYCSLYLLYFIEGITIPGLGIGLVRFLVYFNLPFAVVKLFLTLLQMAFACINVGIMDTNERNQAKATKAQ